MSPNFTDVGRKELDGALFEGSKGWHDNVAQRITISHLRKLAGLGQYDRDVVFAHVCLEKSEHSEKNVVKARS